ncbi:MAG: protein kinase domain-containing protein [Myxococcaceae bacterium]
MPASTLPLAFDQYSGRKLGKYEILCRLSTGGMSVIFLAFQKGLAGFRKFVVLKQILPDIKGEEEFVRMFLDEAKITAAFNNPNIAQVFDLDIQDGELFLAMEFVPGATLVEVAKACRAISESIPTGFSLMAVRDTAMALHYAHTFTDPTGRKQTVIHRDVAEKNIMVTYEGTTKLLDFGIAKSLARLSRTTVGMVKGTSGYMSPEQILGEKLDARSDIFSLGVVLHECLTGMRLFHGKSAEEGMMAALKEPVMPPSRGNSDVTPELDAVVLKALARKREERFSTAREFARAIERAAGSLIWEPEQTSELIARLFTDRREQTRSLMASSESDVELTGEHLLRELLGDPPQKIRAVPPLKDKERDNGPPVRKSSVSQPISVATPSIPPPAIPRRSTTSQPMQMNPPPTAPTPRRPTTSQPIAQEKLGPAGGQRPTRSGRGVSQDVEKSVELLTSAPTPLNRNSPRKSASTPWDDTNAGLPPELEEEGLTIPVGSVPSALIEELERETYEEEPESTTGAGPIPSEESAHGSSILRIKARWASIGIFVGLMLVVFAGGLLVTTVYKKLSNPGRQRDPLPAAIAEAEKAAPTDVPPTPAQVAEQVPAKTVPPPEPAPKKEEVAKEEEIKKVVEPPKEEPRRIAPVVTKREEPRREEKKREEAPPPKRAPAREEPKAEPKKEKETPGLSGPGQLTLVAQPFVSKVIFKSQDLGPTPLFKIPMPAGKHVLKLTAPDNTVRLLTVEIHAGEPTNMRIDTNSLPKE